MSCRVTLGSGTSTAKFAIKEGVHSFANLGDYTATFDVRSASGGTVLHEEVRDKSGSTLGGSSGGTDGGLAASFSTPTGAIVIACNRK
jgi:hypothetical protein